uniref:Uncharacterized protein n=1 Tax=Rhizophora mucronata TaxID=61149 RepID=A0A2P2R1W5_RHIMU
MIVFFYFFIIIYQLLHINTLVAVHSAQMSIPFLLLKYYSVASKQCSNALI